VEKIYLVAVQNRPPQESATLTHYLKKLHKPNKSIALSEPSPGAKEATLTYTYLGATEHYHCLQINLITGRHHQIRAQLAAIGCPVKGDVKYGARRNNPDRSIHLHAWKVRFQHPVSHQMETIKAPLPVDPVWDNFKGIIENEI
jgi:23S rRNA pseudouridine1911/1915/1917 synthase